jgi:hypothetical protein
MKTRWRYCGDDGLPPCQADAWATAATVELIHRLAGTEALMISKDLTVTVTARFLLDTGAARWYRAYQSVSREPAWEALVKAPEDG